MLHKGSLLGLTVEEKLRLSSFDIDPMQVQSERHADELLHQEIMEKMRAEDATHIVERRRTDSHYGIAACSAFPIEVVSSRGWERSYTSVEEAAIDLNMEVQSMHTAMKYPETGIGRPPYLRELLCPCGRCHQPSSRTKASFVRTQKMPSPTLAGS